MAAWHNGNGVKHVNEVTLCLAQLVLVNCLLSECQEAAEVIIL